MPKTFSESERAYIKERLMEEAKSCLMQYGIRKTTVDELVKRVSIPKGTFYLFYESKERLIFDVVLQLNDEIQARMLDDVSALNGCVNADTLTELIFGLYKTLDNSFLPRLIADGELEFFMRTLPPELSKLHAEHDDLSVRELFRLLPGMREDRAEVYSAALRGVFLTLIHKSDIGEARFDEALRVLIYGVVRQMVENESKGEQL